MATFLDPPGPRTGPRGALFALRSPLFAVALGVLLVLPALTQASGFSVAPVRLFFGEKDRAVAIRITNEGGSDLVLQPDLQAWSQDAHGRDQLEPSEDLVVSPPMLRLKPHADQTVRLILATPRQPGRQMSYRLLIREIPPPAPSTGDVQLPIALVLSLPVFITPPKATHRLQCDWQSESDSPAVACENTGLAFARLGRLDLMRGAEVIGRFEGSVYLLPGARRVLPIALAEGATPASATTLQAMLDNAESLRFALEPLATARR